MLADAASAAGPRLHRDRWRGHVAYVSELLGRLESQRSVTEATRRIVTGDTIMAALGIGPGPRVGRILMAIDEAAASGV